MKKTGIPVKWLVSEQEVGKCRDKKGFAEALWGKTILFGVLVLLYGIVSTVNRLVLKIRVLDIVCIIVFLAACVFYVIALNYARKKFF